MRKEAQIQRVLISNYLYTIYFADGSCIEIYKSKFRGTKRPKVGDMFKLIQKPLKEGKIESKMFLNGEEIKGQPL